jgi:hypothetical protein
MAITRNATPVSPPEAEGQEEDNCPLKASMERASR